MRKNLSKIIPTLIFMIMLIVVIAPTQVMAEVITGEFKIGIELSGQKPSSPDKFKIDIAPKVEGEIIPVVQQIVIDGGSEINFPAIKYERIGKYYYTIKQVTGLIPNVTYDESVYELLVTVTNKEQGGFNITKSLRKGIESPKYDKIIFKNRYPSPTSPPSPATTAKVKLRALKTLDKEIPINQRFTFFLSDENGTILQTVSNEGQNIEFEELEYNKIGTSNYYIREKIEVDGKYVYDATVYEVIVKVSRNNNGNYEANISYLINGTPFIRVPIFENQTVSGKLPDTGGEEPEPKPEPEPEEEKPESEPGKLPDTGGEKPEPVVVPDSGVKPGPPELPKTGEAKSTLPLVGIIMILSGITLSIRRKATK